MKHELELETRQCKRHLYECVLVFSRISQDSLDEMNMDDYWTELGNINSSGGEAGKGEGGGDGEVQVEEQQKIPEGRICCARG